MSLVKKLNEDSVPQGSILGPLFIIFFNDFCFPLIKGEMMLYADDTTVSFASISYFQVVTEDLKLISEWLKHNRLLLNLTKTNAIFFSNGAHSTKQTVLPLLIFDDILTSRSNNRQ